MDQDPGATVHRGYTRAGDYDLIRKMGAGGFGTVFEARHRATGLPYAVKRIYLTPEDAERFRNEALYPARIASESLHVLGVISFFHDDSADAFYLVTELIAHGDLRAFLDKQARPLPLALGLDVGLGVAKGLAAIHAQHIVHRDLKPANVLMDRKDGQWIAKIADFGLARSVSSVSIAQFATSGYAAPEQLDLLTDVPLGPESDLFSYGMVLYELLTGDKPTAAVGLKEYGRWLAARVTPPAPSQVRPELAAWPALDRLIARLLDFDRMTRLASAAEVVRVLESVRHPAAAPAPAPAPPTPAPRPAPLPPPPLPAPPHIDPRLRDKTEPTFREEPRWRLRLGMAAAFASSGLAMYLGLPWRWVRLHAPPALFQVADFLVPDAYAWWLAAAAVGLPALFGLALGLAARASIGRVFALVGLMAAVHQATWVVVAPVGSLFGANVAVPIAGGVLAVGAWLAASWVLRMPRSRGRLALVIGVGVGAATAGLYLATEVHRELGPWAPALGFALWQMSIGQLLVPLPAGSPRRPWWPLAAFTLATLLLSALASAK